jgi:hypothetical protein
MTIRVRRIPMRVRVAAAAALAAGGALSGVALAGSAAAATSPHGTTVLHGTPPAAPAGPTWTSNGSSLPPGSKATVMPDGSPGVLKAPPGFVPGQAPSGTTVLHGTLPSAS